MTKIFVIILLVMATTSFASQKAITDTGEEVILNDDGTWEYSEKAQRLGKIIETNKKKFERPINSSFLVKSNKNKSAYWINTDKWGFEKEKNYPDVEYTFRLKGTDLYAMIIAEGIQMDVERLCDIALENAQKKAPDARIVRQEYRFVNGKKVIYMEMRGTIQSVKFAYLGYYHSDESGVTQFITFTGANLVDKYRSEINNCLNGFDTQ